MMTTKRRIIWTLLLVVFFTGFSVTWNAVAPVYEAKAALGQMENDDEAYIIGRTIASWDPVFWVGTLVMVLSLCIWVPVIVRGSKELSKETITNA